MDFYHLGSTVIIYLISPLKYTSTPKFVSVDLLMNSSNNFERCLRAHLREALNLIGFPNPLPSLRDFLKSDLKP